MNSTMEFQTEEMTSSPQFRIAHNPRVSIIIPNFNHARFLGDAIQSVLDQTYTNYEIIVVDDGSTDNSQEIIEKFTENVLYIRQENQGLPGARNTGLRAATGELIALLDADDQHEPDYLIALVAFLEKNPKADIVYCRARFMDENGNLLPQLTGSPVPPNQLYNQLLKANFMTPNCVLAYRYCFEQVGLFDTSIPIGEGDMWLQFAERFTMVGTDKVLTRYRVVTGSMSSINPLPMLESGQLILQKRFGKETADATQWPPVQRDAYARTHLIATIEFLQADKIEQAYEQLKQAFIISPELLSALDIYYELGCGNQPRGYRGYFPMMDVNHNAEILFRLLDEFFNDSAIAGMYDAYKKPAYTHANLVLSKLSYGSGELKNCRRFLLRTISCDLKLVFNREVISLVVKSFLGIKLVEFF